MSRQEETQRPPRPPAPLCGHVHIMCSAEHLHSGGREPPRWCPPHPYLSAAAAWLRGTLYTEKRAFSQGLD